MATSNAKGDGMTSHAGATSRVDQRVVVATETTALTTDARMSSKNWYSTTAVSSRTRGARGVVGALTVILICACAYVTYPRLGFRPYHNPNAPRVWLHKGRFLPRAPPKMNHDVTFTLRTSCKTKEVKDKYSDFWVDGEKEAWIVRHNYRSNRFFEHNFKQAIKMDRVILNAATGERGYTVTTSRVNYEFGFALRNKLTGEWITEIGTPHDQSPLFRDECTQRFGEHFNRALTRESNTTHVEYVFGTCYHQCASNYADSAFTFRYSDNSIPVSPSNVLLTFKSNTAKLFTLHSALMSGGGTGRAIAVRDTRYTGESDTSIRFITAMITPYVRPNYVSSADGRKYVKMMSVHVERDPNDDTFRVSVGDAREYYLGARCNGIECAAGLYDIPALWHHPSATDGWRQNGAYGATLHNLEYTLGEKGDSRIAYFKKQYTDDAYLTDSILAPADRWGADEDVRRMIVQTGGSCGSAWWSGDCVRNWVSRPDESIPATATEKHWILSVMGGNRCDHPPGEGCITMLRVKVFNDAGALRIQVISGKNAVTVTTCPASNYPGCEGDAVNVVNIGAFFDAAPNTLNVASSRTSSDALGIGFLNYALAPEMVPSLAAPPTAATSSANALLGVVEKELAQKLGSTRIPVPGGEPPAPFETFDACLSQCSRRELDFFESAISVGAQACANLTSSDVSCFNDANCVEVRNQARGVCPGLFA